MNLYQEKMGNNRELIQQNMNKNAYDRYSYTYKG